MQALLKFQADPSFRGLLNLALEYWKMVEVGVGTVRLWHST